MLFLACSMKENVWKKDRSSQVQTRINPPLLFTWSSRQILIDLKGFTCHWRFVTRSQQLCSKSFLLPDIEVSSFSVSCPLLQYFNRQASKRNNLAKGKGCKPVARRSRTSCKVNQVSVPGYYIHYYYYYYY